jgi:hypothetical protein
VITNPAGRPLGDRYVLSDRLAVGGMGEVWTARDQKLNRDVAVKLLRTDLAPDPAFQTRFRAEARTAAMLSHGGIAAVYDYGESNGASFLVMELVPGEPLSAMIAREGALGSDRTLQIVGQAARALHAAHRHGVVHRDIKPANLMITPELRVKVTDFGIARPRDHEPLTATGQVMGTAHYLAPELARGEIASPLSDVYALGVVAYECLAGWRPFDGDDQIAVATAHLQDEPPPLPQTIPAPVRGIVMSAMAKNPKDRPQGANALAALMEDARLRGLAGPVPGGDVHPSSPTVHAYDPMAHWNQPPAAPARREEMWPLDAATPPRGTVRAQHATRRGGGDGAVPQPVRQPTMSMPMASPVPRARASARASARSGGRPRRGMTLPLLALAVLVALVVAGALLARSRNSATNGAPSTVRAGWSVGATGAGVARAQPPVQASGVAVGAPTPAAGSERTGRTR